MSHLTRSSDTAEALCTSLKFKPSCQLLHRRIKKLNLKSPAIGKCGHSMSSNYNTNKHASLTKKNVKHKINTNKTEAKFSRLLRHPGMETEWDYSGRMGRGEKQEDR